MMVPVFDYHVTFRDATGQLHGVVVYAVASKEEAETKATQIIGAICAQRLWNPKEFKLVSTELYVERILS